MTEHHNPSESQSHGSNPAQNTEFDIRPGSVDKDLILRHDQTLNRTTNGDRAAKKTLKEVDRKAVKLYKTHKSKESKLSSVFYQDTYNKLRYEQRQNTQEAEEFAKEYAEQLHDLAVIEAHLGGIAINVEQPITIGQKVEVHTPDHQ